MDEAVVLPTAIRVKVKAWLVQRDILHAYDGLVYLRWLSQHGKIGGPQDRKDPIMTDKDIIDELVAALKYERVRHRPYTEQSGFVACEACSLPEISADGYPCRIAQRMDAALAKAGES